MSQRVNSTPVAPAAVAAGASIDVSEFLDFDVYISGTFVATIALEYSPDPKSVADASSEWIVHTADLPAGRTACSDRCMKMRLNTTAFTSGTPVAKMVAQKG